MGILCFSRQFNQILFTALFLIVAITSTAQVKSKRNPASAPKQQLISPQLRDFTRLTAQADVQFIFPEGFKETKILNNEDFSFDYAIEIPGQEFEVWFQVKPQKRDWQNYIISKNDPGKQTPDPDTAYIALGHAQASALSEDQNWINRDVPPDALNRYNASAGKSYLLSLPDRVETKHYKYALVLAIEKDHTGTILAVCFTNDKSPEFFKNVNGISRYIHFVGKM